MENSKAIDKLRCLQLLKMLDTKADYRRYTGALAKDTLLGLQEQLRLIELQQQTSLPYSLDTLNKYKKMTMTGGMFVYKDAGKETYHLTDNAIINTVIAYRIMKAKGGHEKELQAMRRYFLEKRGNGYWRNTYESALILSTILPDLLKEGKLQASSITLQGALETSIDKYPYQAGFSPDQPLIVSKADQRPVYVTAYQQYWNTAPVAQEKDFVVTTYIDNKNADLVELKAGKPVKLVLEVEVKQEAEYVMLEVPIPAGCSYEDKRTNYSYEVHRQYFSHKTSIFCQQLKKGKYEFTIQLLPRFTGLYTINPAKAQLMYFPVFYGSNMLKQVKVE
jgi:uncharacterized protein YfaS (alpha-2-macroglobulin family)